MGDGAKTEDEARRLSGDEIAFPPAFFRSWTGTVCKTGSMHEAAEKGDLVALEKHMVAGREMGYPDHETLRKRDDVLGATCLHFAAENGHLHVVKWLLDKGVEMTAWDANNVSPLHLAAIRGWTDVVQELLGRGCPTDGRDKEGDAPMHWAATKGHLGIMQLLNRYGGQLDIPNNQGWTPLHRAVYNGHIRVMEWLLNNGASIHFVNQDGNTPLHLACQVHRLSCIETLLRFGSNTGLRNKDGFTPADVACNESIRELIEEKAAAGASAEAPAPGSEEMQQAMPKRFSFIRRDVAPAGIPEDTIKAKRPAPVVMRRTGDGFPLAAQDSPVRIDKPDIIDSEDPESMSLFSYMDPAKNVHHAFAGLQVIGEEAEASAPGSTGRASTFSGWSAEDPAHSVSGPSSQPRGSRASKSPRGSAARPTGPQKSPSGKSLGPTARRASEASARRTSDILGPPGSSPGAARRGSRDVAGVGAPKWASKDVSGLSPSRRGTRDPEGAPASAARTPVSDHGRPRASR